MDDDERDEFTGKKRFDRKRADLKALLPHELKSSNPFVMWGVIFVLLAIMVGGWYLTRYVAERHERARQPAEEQKENSNEYSKD